VKREDVNCKAIRELLVAYLDGETTPADNAFIEEHLAGCPECREELEALSATQGNLRGALKLMADEASPSPQVWEQIKNRLDIKINLLDSLRSLILTGRLQRLAAVAAIIIIAALVFVWRFGGLGQVPEAEEELVVMKEIEEMVVEEWANFIKFNGITYERTFQSLPYSEEELEYFDEVRFRVDINIDAPGYQIKDGDAAHLDEGTRIYSISGYSPNFRLVAETGTELLLFEADTNPNAITGADLLDIGGKVEYIGINDPVDGKTELASITEQDLVSSLVEMVFEAPVDQADRTSGNQQVFIEFHLKDGTKVNRSFWPDTGKLERGIMLSDDFWEIIKPFVPVNDGDE
jgi:hypothetical protein